MRVLHFLKADPGDFDVVFVANATAGVKLVVDSFAAHERGFWYGYHRDAHTSLVGVREAAKGGSHCFRTDQEVEQWLDNENIRMETDLGLFAYPAQSNMNGRRLPLDWSGRVHRLERCPDSHIFTLLDAAAFVSTSSLDLSDAIQAPDFTVLSFYKIFGFPDLGALIIRKEAGHILRHRKYFGGGTVEIVSCLEENWHVKKENSLHEQLEDGTLPIHSIIALDSAFNVHQQLFGSIDQVSSHTAYLASRLYDGLTALRHGNGSAVCVMYKDVASSYNDGGRTQGPVIAFNLRDNRGGWVSNMEVEKLAGIKNFHLRSGSLCNPGGIASVLGLAPWEMKRNFSAGQRCDNEIDTIGGKPTGVLRVSLGAMSTLQDVHMFLEFLLEFFVSKERSAAQTISKRYSTNGFFVETLTIYPIKSCGGWRIPEETSWIVKPEGLAWDREWCLVHQGSRTALSQKRYPRMALFKPRVDLFEGVLHVRYHGPIPPKALSEIRIPLSEDPSVFDMSATNCTQYNSRVCGDGIVTKTYALSTINEFFSSLLDVPCSLVRFPASGLGPSSRHFKAHLQPYQNGQNGSPALLQAMPTLAPRPILLSNESPILTVSRSSLNRLNEIIKQSSGKAASAEVFRANIVIAEDPSSPSGTEQPYIEDTWLYMITTSTKSLNNDESTTSREEPTYFEMLGPCRRCQMVCVDQSTAEKNEEPFVTLAKTRRFDGKVFFGQHTGLVTNLSRGEARIRAGDEVVGVSGGEDCELLGLDKKMASGQEVD